MGILTMCNNINIFENGRLTKYALKMLKEFEEFSVEDITIKHLEVLEQHMNSWDGKLSNKTNKKLFIVSKYLMETKK